MKLIQTIGHERNSAESTLNSLRLWYHRTSECSRKDHSMSEQFQTEFDTPGRRLWTPWRMNYVGGETRESGCIFCNRLNGDDDVSSLILHRSERCFVIMNLYPYNTGHIMIVPNQHIASPEDVDPEVLAEMARLLPMLLRSLRRVLSCHGFNVGLNVGSIAGAGVAEHLHQHVVPRWSGDANFMPILGGAMVIPELIPASYAKIRAEVERELSSPSAVTLKMVVLDPGANAVLLEPEGTLPSVKVESELPVWRHGTDYVSHKGTRASVIGWAGANRASASNDITLTMLADSTSNQEEAFWHSLESNEFSLGVAGDSIRRSLTQLAPLLGRC